MLVAQILVVAWLLIASIVILKITSIVVLEHVLPTSDNKPRYVREVAISVVLTVFGLVIIWLFKR